VKGHGLDFQSQGVAFPVQGFSDDATFDFCVRQLIYLNVAPKEAMRLEQINDFVEPAKKKALWVLALRLAD
jgi:hypothetical protein